ncbi:MAG: hypothetical protein ACLGG1_08800 [Gammaproteobacteria bacterium]|jgi:hypothetical protein
MRFKTIKDIIDFSRHLHTELARQYAELEQLATSERAQLMLDYLNRHEQHLAEALKDYEAGAARGIMDAWLQYTPELDAHQVLERIRDMDINNVEEVVATALATDEYLREIYEEVAQRADLDEIREVARSLRQIESNEQYRLARDALRFSDL